jgi:hypothetical protein
MKIANWNIERLKNQSKIIEISQILNEIDADILVLTETDSRIKLDNYKYNISTANLHSWFNLSFFKYHDFVIIENILTSKVFVVDSFFYDFFYIDNVKL